MGCRTQQSVLSLQIWAYFLASDSRTCVLSQGNSYGGVFRSWRLVVLGNLGLLDHRHDSQGLRGVGTNGRQDQYGQGDPEDCFRVAHLCQ